MQNLASWGFISCYVFMATNYYLGDKPAIEHRFLVKEKYSMLGWRHHRNERIPVVRIDYFKFEKDLVFRYEDTDKINNADSVIVTVRKGGLGFDVLDDYDVLN